MMEAAKFFASFPDKGDVMPKAQRIGIVTEARELSKAAGRSRGRTVGKMYEQGASFQFLRFEYEDVLKKGDMVEFQMRNGKAQILRKAGRI